MSARAWHGCAIRRIQAGAAWSGGTTKTRSSRACGAMRAIALAFPVFVDTAMLQHDLPEHGGRDRD
ncbi:hypothetical protein [Sphingobium cloacae]|uniref:hypothetical protein n=1 Tax=Sphingobium cloacae TaxID=120107 RepID=UPI000F504D74|nr:hypothetical protein [Sphingobium cloacae]